jgi:hypothetical protein
MSLVLPVHLEPGRVIGSFPQPGSSEPSLIAGLGGSLVPRAVVHSSY